MGVAYLLANSYLVPGLCPVATLPGPTQTFYIIIKQRHAEQQNSQLLRRLKVGVTESL